MHHLIQRNPALLLSLVLSASACSLMVAQDELTPDQGEKDPTDASSGGSSDQQQASGGSGGDDSSVDPSGGNGGGTEMGTGGELVDPPEPGELGEGCATSDGCKSGFCADGTCCESACDGTCQACSADGICDVTPADDDACGTISCPTGNNECLLYDSAITSNRCQAFGECKTSAQCGTQDVARGATCSLGSSDNSICQSGTCAAPVVSCGAQDCVISEPLVCCNTTTSQICSGSCASTAINEPARVTALLCDEHEDCRTGQLCTLVSAGVTFIRCEEDSNASGVGFSHREVCASPTMAEVSCSDGSLGCEPLTNVSFGGGWKFCQ